MAKTELQNGGRRSRTKILMSVLLRSWLPVYNRVFKLSPWLAGSLSTRATYASYFQVWAVLEDSKVMVLLL